MIFVKITAIALVLLATSIAYSVTESPRNKKEVQELVVAVPVLVQRAENFYFIKKMRKVWGFRQNHRFTGTVLENSLSNEIGQRN